MRLVTCSNNKNLTETRAFMGIFNIYIYIYKHIYIYIYIYSWYIYISQGLAQASPRSLSVFGSWIPAIAWVGRTLRPTGLLLTDLECLCCAADILGRLVPNLFICQPVLPLIVLDSTKLLCAGAPGPYLQFTFCRWGGLGLQCFLNIWLSPGSAVADHRWFSILRSTGSAVAYTETRVIHLQLIHFWILNPLAFRHCLVDQFCDRVLC